MSIFLVVNTKSMPLKELEKDIQSRDSKAKLREHNKTVYNEWQSKEEDVKESAWQQIADRMKNTRIKAIITGGIIITVIVVLLLMVVSFVFFQKGFFARDRVTLSVESLQNVESNKITEVVFSYENDNRAHLSDAEIVVRFGDYFIPEENQENFTRVSDSQGVITLGTIKGGEKGRLVLAGHFAGPRGASGDVAGTLRYTPERTSTRYDVNARATSTITSSPIAIEIDSPIEIVSGNLVDIAVKIQNTNTDTLSKLKFTLDMPESFSFYDAQPRASHGSVWLIDTLLPQSEVVIHVRGGLDAPIGSVQRFGAEVGTQESGGAYVSYANTLYSPRIVRSPIIVNQKVESQNPGVVYAGEILRYHVTFKNDSNISLRDSVVTLNLDGEVLNYGSLELMGVGDYDQANQRIVWKASDVPALKVLGPQESGEVSFMVTVKNQLPVQDENDHHFSVISVASIDSNDIPSQLRENKTVLSNVMTLPVGAKVMLSSALQYRDGANPPAVGKKTTYTVAMKAESINNDIADTIVHIPLPTHTKFEGSTSDELTFNERTNEVVWNLGDVVHGTGVTRSAREISFDISIVPSVEQVETKPLLVKEQVLSAKDRFTGFLVKDSSDHITTGSHDQVGGESDVQP